MRNLDPDLYTDPALHTRECEQIFWLSWQMLDPAARFDAPGPLSPRHEYGVAWFQNRMREVLGRGAG